METKTEHGRPRLDWSARSYGDQKILQATGDLDLAGAPVLREALRELIESGHHRIVLDLDQVAFCDSVGLGVIVGAFSRIEDSGTNGYLRIVCRGPVRRAFELTGLARVVSLHSDLADACSEKHDREQQAAVAESGTGRHRADKARPWKREGA